MSGVGLKLKGLGYTLLQWGIFSSPTGKEQTSCGFGREAAGSQPAADARLFSRLELERGGGKKSLSPANLQDFGHFFVSRTQPNSFMQSFVGSRER